MFKIKIKDGNESVNVNINSVNTEYKFDTELEIDETTVNVLKDAGYELEEIKKAEVV